MKDLLRSPPLCCTLAVSVRLFVVLRIEHSPPGALGKGSTAEELIPSLCVVIVVLLLR